MRTDIIFRLINKIMGERPLQDRYAATSGRFELTTLAVCIKKLLKTNKFEITVRRSGSLVVSVPSGSNSTLATT